MSLKAYRILADRCDGLMRRCARELSGTHVRIHDIVIRSTLREASQQLGLSKQTILNRLQHIIERLALKLTKGETHE